MKECINRLLETYYRYDVVYMQLFQRINFAVNRYVCSFLICCCFMEKYVRTWKEITGKKGDETYINFWLKMPLCEGLTNCFGLKKSDDPFI